MVNARPPPASSTCKAASTTTSRLSCGRGTLRRLASDRQGGSGTLRASQSDSVPSDFAAISNSVLAVNSVL
jgi:hypothetical protein